MYTSFLSLKFAPTRSPQPLSDYGFPNVPNKYQSHFPIAHTNFYSLQNFQPQNLYLLSSTQNPSLNPLLIPFYDQSNLNVKTEDLSSDISLKEEPRHDDQICTPFEHFYYEDFNHRPQSSLSLFGQQALWSNMTNIYKNMHKQVKEKVWTAQEISQIKAYLFRMVEYFVHNFSKDRLNEVQHQRSFYLFDERMLKVFDALETRYSFNGKCREDMARFTMRKALTFLRNQERKESQTNIHNASISLCHKYFLSEIEENQYLQSFNNDDELLCELLPYKKNSKNKTPNHEFTMKIFSSEAFCTDYQIFLSKFIQIMNKDNTKRIKKFVDFLVTCVEQDNFDKISIYKRLPWLNVWIESTNTVANELLVQNSLKGPEKMVGEITPEISKKRGRVPYTRRIPVS